MVYIGYNLVTKIGVRVKVRFSIRVRAVAILRWGRGVSRWGPKKFEICAHMKIKLYTLYMSRSRVALEWPPNI